MLRSVKGSPHSAISNSVSSVDRLCTSSSVGSRTASSRTCKSWFPSSVSFRACSSSSGTRSHLFPVVPVGGVWAVSSCSLSSLSVLALFIRKRALLLSPTCWEVFRKPFLVRPSRIRILIWGPPNYSRFSFLSTRTSSSCQRTPLRPGTALTAFLSSRFLTISAFLPLIRFSFRSTQCRCLSC